MKSLNTYINEGLADWGDDESFDKKMDEQTSEEAIKREIIKWITSNGYHYIITRQLEFDFNTDPITVNYDGSIKVDDDYITSLTNGIFQWGEVGKDFRCAWCNSLISLDGAPKEVGGKFSCGNCDSLKNLKGAPEKVKGVFNCSYCDSLTSLEGAPKEVRREFSCNNCINLISLKGAPEKVKKYFNCSHCISLKTLEGAPKKVMGSLECVDCGVKFTEEDVRKVSKVKEKIYC